MANEDRGARYHRLRRRAAVGSVALGGAFLTLLLLTGASAALRDAIAPQTGPSLVPLLTGYMVVLVLVHELSQLPFRFYRGVTLERRYGLSNVPAPAWWASQVREVVVGLVLAVPAAFIVVGLMRSLPDHWWMASGAIFGLVLVVLARMAPVALLPWVYDLAPLSRAGLGARLAALAGRTGTRVTGVFEWRLSGGTRRARAALVGVGGARRILLSDTLLSEHSDDEIEVIVAHELAHHIHHHVWLAILLETGLLIVAFYAADVVLSMAAGSFGSSGKDDIAALPLLLLVAGAVWLALTPIVNACSRAHERRADRYALEITQNAEAFVRAIRRLAAQNLVEEQPPRLVRVCSTHPTTAARIAAAEQWACREQGRWKEKDVRVGAAAPAPAAGHAGLLPMTSRGQTRPPLEG